MSESLGGAAAGPVLILAPTRRDADGAAALLGRDGVETLIFPDAERLADAIGETAGAVMIAVEALTAASLAAFTKRLAMQPPWSDLPFIILTYTGAKARRGLLELHLPEALGNVMFLERPLNTLSLISAARAALRARRRQRQVSQYLAEQKAADSALRESEARFRHMADSAPALIWMTDALGKVIFANMHHGYLLGDRAADVFEDLSQIVMPEDRAHHHDALAAAFADRTPFTVDARVCGKDKEIRWLRWVGAPRLNDTGRFLGFTGCNVDITEARLAAEDLEKRVVARTGELSQAVGQLNREIQEREQAELALRQAQKMDAIGQLTGGIAHDFNNMLQGIAGSLEMTERRIRQGKAEDAERFVEAATKTVARAAALTHRLLAFARRQALTPVLVNIDEIVEGLADLIRRTVGPGIVVVLERGDGACNVLCDPNQLESAVLNLAINARDAMPEGGQIRITTHDVALGAADVKRHEGAVPGNYVELTVADTGIGMPADVLARAFEPFFTTKPMGQGTGLGLSQLYGFVRQSGGIVRLESTAGEGTAVRLFLPSHAGVDAVDAADDLQRRDVESASSGTILIVDDEAVVRELLVETMQEMGCEVLEAEDGPGGLEILRSNRQIDLLITDVGLPGLNGRQLADAGRELRPGLPVLLITGYAGTALENGSLAPGMEIISKPFRLEDLAARSSEILKHQLLPAQ